LAVQLGTLWLTTASFGIIPLYGLICNLLVVPFCTVILYVFLCFLIIMGISGLCGIRFTGALAFTDISYMTAMPTIRSSIAGFFLNALQYLNELLHCLAGWLENTVSFFARLPCTPIHYQPGPGGQILILFCTVIVYILLRRNDRNL